MPRHGYSVRSSHRDPTPSWRHGLPQRATHWSKRELARQVGIWPTSVMRIRRTFGLQP